VKTQPRAQLVIRFAPTTNSLQAVRELQNAGWEAWEQPAVTKRRRRTSVVVEAWTSRLRGDRQSVAEATIAQAREVLSEFTITRMEVNVSQHSPAPRPTWKVVKTKELPKAEGTAFTRTFGGLLIYGDKKDAERRVLQMMTSTTLTRDTWTLERHHSWSEQLRQRQTVAPILVTLAAAVLGITFGMLAAPDVSNVAEAFWPTLILTLGGASFMFTGAIIQIANTTRRRAITALAFLLIGIVALLCGATILGNATGHWWISSAMLGLVVVAMLIQGTFGSSVFARMRMSAFKLPIAVILGAVGLTALILALNIPLASFYLAVGAPELIGRASWGTVITTGVWFTAATAIAVTAGAIGIVGWRRHATLLRPRLVGGALVAALFAWFGFTLLGVYINDGNLAREGSYGSAAHAEWMFPVCVINPQTAEERTPLWLLGTDGQTNVMLDRTQLTNKTGKASQYPHYLDIGRPLKYVDADQTCG